MKRDIRKYAEGFFFFLIKKNLKNMGHIELIQSIKKCVRVIRITTHFSMISL